MFNKKILTNGRLKKSSKMEWEEDKILESSMREIVITLKFTHINPDRIFCYRTHGAKARAYARIWAFPKIFQRVLNLEPAYVIEVLSEKFDKLSPDNRIKVIIHELLHIPKNFSGSLLPHSHGKKTIEKEVERLYKSMGDDK